MPVQGPEVIGNIGAVLKLGGALGTGHGPEQMTLDRVLKENEHFGVLCTYTGSPAWVLHLQNGTGSNVFCIQCFALLYH